MMFKLQYLLDFQSAQVSTRSPPGYVNTHLHLSQSMLQNMHKRVPEGGHSLLVDTC